MLNVHGHGTGRDDGPGDRSLAEKDEEVQVVTFVCATKIPQNL